MVRGSYSNAAFFQQHLFHCRNGVIIHTYRELSVTWVQGKKYDGVTLKTSDGVFLEK